jgi:hypothetical protein
MTRMIFRSGDSSPLRQNVLRICRAVLVVFVWMGATELAAQSIVANPNPIVNPIIGSPISNPILQAPTRPGVIAPPTVTAPIDEIIIIGKRTEDFCSRNPTSCTVITDPDQISRLFRTLTVDCISGAPALCSDAVRMLKLTTNCPFWGTMSVKTLDGQELKPRTDNSGLGTLAPLRNPSVNITANPLPPGRTSPVTVKIQLTREGRASTESFTLLPGETLTDDAIATKFGVSSLNGASVIIAVVKDGQPDGSVKVTIVEIAIKDGCNPVG